MLIRSRREWRRQATRFFRATLSTLGAVLPRHAKVFLARRSTKLGHLLARDGEFVIDDYLGRFRMNIDARYTAERVILGGIYEPDLWWAISRYLKPGGVAVDIGANVGAVTVRLAQAVGPEGRVFAFEPGPVFFDRLCANLALNPELSGVVRAFKLGVSDSPGTLHWEEDPEFPGNAYLFGGHGIAVPVVTLEEALQEQTRRIDFLKIDVEGMELEVLRGAARCLERYQPVVFFESSLDFEVFRKAPVRKLAAELLENYGYRLYAIQGEQLRSVRYPHFAQNTLALPRHHSADSW